MTRFLHRPIPKIGVVLYALFMAFMQAHYITAQLYPDSEYFFGVWSGVSDAQLWTGETLAMLANIGLLLSPFLPAPSRALRLLLICSLGFGAVVSAITLVHLFSINLFYPFWPARPGGFYIKMFIETLLLYSIYLLALYLYITKIKQLHTYASQTI